MFKHIPPKVVEDFMRIAQTIVLPATVLEHYRQTAELFKKDHPDTPYPSYEWFRRQVKKRHAEKQTTSEPSNPHADLDLTPADGQIRKYRAFLRLYRHSADQVELDRLLDATCPEIWEN